MWPNCKEHLIITEINKEYGIIYVLFINYPFKIYDNGVVFGRQRAQLVLKLKPKGGY